MCWFEKYTSAILVCISILFSFLAVLAIDRAIFTSQQGVGERQNAQPNVPPPPPSPGIAGHPNFQSERSDIYVD